MDKGSLVGKQEQSQLHCQGQVHSPGTHLQLKDVLHLVLCFLKTSSLL